MSAASNKRLLEDIEREVGCWRQASEGWYVKTCRERSLKRKCARCLLVGRLERVLAGANH